MLHLAIGQLASKGTWPATARVDDDLKHVHHDGQARETAEHRPAKMDVLERPCHSFYTISAIPGRFIGHASQVRRLVLLRWHQLQTDGAPPDPCGELFARVASRPVV